MNHKPRTGTKTATITVGIPAFNEAANIGFLIREVLGQKLNHAVITKVIIASDNSTDQSREIVEAIGDSRVVFLDNKTREGQAARQNQVLAMADTDIVVLINADITFNEPLFMERLTAPIIEGRADLTSSNMLTVPPSSLFEHVLQVGLIMRNRMFEMYRDGQNMYTCHGAARAFSARLYKKFRFLSSVGEDGYSYLYCIYYGMSYVYARQAVAYIKLPDNLRDHQKQSVRFFNSKAVWEAEFGSELVARERRLPVSIMLRALLSMIIEQPVQTCMYTAIVVATKIKSMFAEKSSTTWDIATSSKVLRPQVK